MPDNRKKLTGLSKKVPAIFEGLPDIDELGRKEHKAARVSSVQAPQSEKNPVLLVEINAIGIKALLSQIDTKNCAIHKIYSSRWPAPDGALPEPSVIKLEIEKCLREFGVQKVQSRLFIRAGGTYMSLIDKPDAPAGQMKDALIWQLAEKVTFPVERSEICFHESDGMLTVAAMDIEVRGRVLEAFHEFGLYPEKIVPLPVLYESLQQKRSMLGNANALVLDLSEDQLSMMAYSKGRFQLMRVAPYGMDQIVKAMKGTLMVENAAIVIDSREAEALLAEFGLPTPNLALDPQEPKLSQLSARIRPVFEKMAQEIRSTLLQFQKQSPAEKIEEVCLSGAGEAIKGFDQYLANQLNLPVRRLDLKNLDSRLDAGWAGVLSLGYVSSTPFNFATLEDVLKPKFEKVVGNLKRLAILSFLGIAGLAVFLVAAEAGKKKQLAGQNSQFNEILAQSQTMTVLQALKTQIEAKQELFKAELPQNFHFGAIFREITHLVPSSLILTRVTFQSEPAPALSFSGKVLPGVTDPDGAISDFLKILNTSPFFERSGLESRSVQESQQVAEFRIRADLVPPEGTYAA